MRGTVTVSDTPGDPEAEPDPVPKSNVDLKKPVLRDARLPRRSSAPAAPRCSIRSASTASSTSSTTATRARASAKFAGYATYKAHVGYNRARIGKRKPHFKPKRGRYMIELRATDNANNTSKVQRLKFRIW